MRRKLPLIYSLFSWFFYLMLEYGIPFLVDNIFLSRIDLTSLRPFVNALAILLPASAYLFAYLSITTGYKLYKINKDKLVIAGMLPSVLFFILMIINALGIAIKYYISLF